MDIERSGVQRMSTSSCSQLAAYCSPDETVRVWQVRSGLVLHQYQPARQLSAPVTCVLFADVSAKNISPKSNFKGATKEGRNGALVMGTQDGWVLYYNWADGRVLHKWKPVSDGSAITHLFTLCNRKIAILTKNNKLTLWDLTLGEELKQYSVSGCSSVCLLGGRLAAVASQGIDLIDMENSGKVVNKFTGHASPTTCLLSLPNADGHINKTVSYFVSASHNDSFVYMWEVNEEKDDNNCLKGPHITFKAKEQVSNVCVSARYIAVVSVTGVLRLFKSNTRTDLLKPRSSIAEIAIFSDAEHEKIIPIHRAFNITKSDFAIAYGIGVFLKFERIKLSELEGRVELERSISLSLSMKGRHAQQLDTDLQHDKATHITPALMPSVAGKRKAGSDEPMRSSLPMEAQMLQMTSEDATNDTPLANTRKNHMQLLVQGLHSNDGKLLQRVLTNRNREVINTTVASLPSLAIVPLITHLQTLLPQIWHRNMAYSLWLRALFSQHGAFVESLPTSEPTRPFKQYCIARHEVLRQETKLKGRLTLWLKQLKRKTKSTNSPEKFFVPLITTIVDESSSEDECNPKPCSNGHGPLTNGFSSHGDKDGSDSALDDSDEDIDAAMSDSSLAAENSDMECEQEESADLQQNGGNSSDCDESDLS